VTTHVSAVSPLSAHDTTRIDDTRISAVRPLITPALLQEWLPVPEAILSLVEHSRAAISRVLHGADDRLIVVVGTCCRVQERYLRRHQGRHRCHPGGAGGTRFHEHDPVCR
jgi:hypothetical protein